MIASCEFSSNGRSSSSHTIRSIGTGKVGGDQSLSPSGSSSDSLSDGRSTSRYNIASVPHYQLRLEEGRRLNARDESVMVTFCVISWSRCLTMNPGPLPRSNTSGNLLLMSYSHHGSSSVEPSQISRGIGSETHEQSIHHVGCDIILHVVCQPTSLLVRCCSISLEALDGPIEDGEGRSDARSCCEGRGTGRHCVVAPEGRCDGPCGLEHGVVGDEEQEAKSS
jgi:hypothetical protein